MGLVRLSGQSGVAGRCHPERPAEMPVQVALIEEPGRLRDLSDGNPALKHPPRDSDPVAELGSGAAASRTPCETTVTAGGD